MAAHFSLFRPSGSGSRGEMTAASSSRSTTSAGVPKRCDEIARARAARSEFPVVGGSVRSVNGGEVRPSVHVCRTARLELTAEGFAEAFNFSRWPGLNAA